MGRGHAADTPHSYQCKYRPLALASLRNAVERRSAADLRRIPQVRRGEFRKTQTQGPKASRSCLIPERAATTMTTHANIYPTFTIKDFAKAHGQRPQNRGQRARTVRCRCRPQQHRLPP